MMKHLTEDTFEDLYKSIKLTENQRRFFDYLTNEKSDTKGDILKSYYKAGYRHNMTSDYTAEKLYKSRKIQKLLVAFYQKRMENHVKSETALERVKRRNDLIYKIAEGRIPPDLPIMKGCNEFDAKIHGLLADRVIHETEDRLAIAPEVQPQAIEEANRLLLNAGQDDINIIDAEFTAAETIPAETEEKEDLTPEDFLSDEESA